MEEYLILPQNMTFTGISDILNSMKKENTFINNYNLKYQNKKFRSDFEHLNYLYNYISDDEKNYI